MAETIAAPAPAAAAAADKKKVVEKPEKPNTDLFNEQLAKAEKEYQEAFAKYVCCFPCPSENSLCHAPAGESLY